MDRFRVIHVLSKPPPWFMRVCIHWWYLLDQLTIATSYYENITMSQQADTTCYEYTYPAVFTERPSITIGTVLPKHSNEPVPFSTRNQALPLHLGIATEESPHICHLRHPHPVGVHQLAQNHVRLSRWSPTRSIKWLHPHPHRLPRSLLLDRPRQQPNVGVTAPPPHRPPPTTTFPTWFLNRLSGSCTEPNHQQIPIRSPPHFLHPQLHPHHQP